MNDPRLDRIAEITKQCREALKRNAPEVQGAVLADLVAMFLAGHAPVLRDGVFDQLSATIKALVPVNEAIMFDGMGHPAKDLKLDEWEDGDGNPDDHAGS